MKLTLPELSLVLLIGASGSGKSTFARKHFKPTEVLSSDHYRGVVSDSEIDQSASQDAFDVLHYIAAKRLAAGRLTVIDATNVRAEDRKTLLNLARKYHFFAVAIVFNLPEQLCHDRNRHRSDRNFGPHVVRRQISNLRRSRSNLKREGFLHIYTLSSVEEIDAVAIARQPLWNNRKDERGPFDIIGDIHGCCDELEALLQKLGYESTPESPPYRHPQGRKVIFLGDLVDRGPRILDTLSLVRNMVAGGTALCVPGNHDMKLLRKLSGKKVQVKHGLEQTLAELEALPEEVRETVKGEIVEFLNSLVSHYVLDEGNLVVAHAGMKESMQGRGSRKVRDFALYGETTGEIDEFGLPVRYPWAEEYRGNAMAIYGHTPVPEAQWLNNTIDIDTGCVFGGKLTALRYPEKELVSVAAARVYCEPVKPLFPPETSPLTVQQELDDVLDLEDVLGKRIIHTRLQQKITIQEENAIAALEVMSRFAANPKWLIYLPPTMSPSETSQQPGLLEHPAEAFAYYQQRGVRQVICEEKHMGSRAVVILCRDESVAKQRFGIVDEGLGLCYTRTGRRFFNDLVLEAQFLQRLQSALSRVGFWEEFQTDWACLDCELMPWSAKAQELLKQQYAAVGTAARVSLSAAVGLLEKACDRIKDAALRDRIKDAALRDRGVDLGDTLTQYQQREQLAERYVAAYRRYCWPVNSLDDLQLAPFHLLATEGAVRVDKNHSWHMETLAKICQADEALLTATRYKLVDLGDSRDRDAAIAWWEELTDAGGEGMVVKPLDFITRGKRGLLQPALKCRGREYLRIIYGAEYTLPNNLERLRQRGLGRKRSLALREFSLGVEALERFANREPLRRTHECVFAILALESEPVDPRL